MLKFEPSFKYDKQTKSTICELTDGREIFCGKAFCHPEDMDMGNEKTGSEIAFRRAYIKLLKRDKLDVKVALAALNQLYYSKNLIQHLMKIKCYKDRYAVIKMIQLHFKK